MPTSKRLRTTSATGGNSTRPDVTGASAKPRDEFLGNMGTADVRGNHSTTTNAKTITQVITLSGISGVDSFKIRVSTPGDLHGQRSGDVEHTDTVAFVAGTNMTAAAIQVALRTALDATCTVAGSTDTGPFTVTFVGNKQAVQLLQLVSLSGMSGHVTYGTLAYDDADVHSTVRFNGIAFDQETSRGVQQDVPLGLSIVTDGTGQTKGTTLDPPAIAAAGVIGGSGQVVIDTTEDASGGTSATVLTALRNIDTGKFVTVDNDDADGDQTISSLAAGNYAAYFHTVTANGRVSRPSPPEYFTVT